MNIPLMKYADEYIGRILCALLGRNRSQQAAYTDKPANILFIKFWGMGSIILTAPAVQAVREKFPQAKLHYLTFEANREVLEVMGIAESIITIKLSNPFRFNIDTLKLIKKLHQKNFDIVYDFEFFTYYSALINRLAKPKYSTGFDNKKNKRSRLFTHTVEFNDHIHTQDNFLNLVKAISPLKANGLPKVMWVTERGSLQKSFITELLLSNQNKSTSRILKDVTAPYIVINPNASKMAYERRLPAKYFVKMIDKLNAAGKDKLVLTGTQEEISYVSAIYEQLQSKEQVLDLTGKLNVNELFSLIGGAECLITNDSGPLHIASALNKPVIAFFGPESPVRYGPLSPKQLVFYRSLECSPCMSVSNSKTVNCIYNEPKCMTGFDVEEIISDTRSFINNLDKSAVKK